MLGPAVGPSTLDGRSRLEDSSLRDWSMVKAYPITMECASEHLAARGGSYLLCEST
jgi:hypothetical protein